jgi:murein DD-endopeptidase MepM/ murein hydrolase activator NlpD
MLTTNFITKAVLIFILISMPVISNAGFFDFLSEVFRWGNEVDNTENSQNMALLQAALNSDPNPAKGGGEITIVGGTALLAETGPSGSLADIEDVPNSDQISIYVVREGDSISQIAKMFGVTTNTIIWANDIKRGSLIREGQTLIILPISGISHTVKSGETVRSIAKKYKGDYTEVLNYNGLTLESVVTIGDVVVVPDGEVATPRYSGSTALVRGTGGPAYDGYYLRPVGGGTKSQSLHGYNAIDLATYAGAPIFAAADGQVIISKGFGWNGGYGRYVVIKHSNGTQTLYAHNSQNIVYPGQKVVKGQVIGYVGSSGKSTGAHLHFEIRGARNPF